MSLFERLARWFSGGAPDDMTPEGDAPAISCEDALRLVHDFLDGELDDVSAHDVEAHFEVCQRCYPHLRLEHAYREAVRRAAAGERAPEALRERVAARLAEVRADG